MHYGLRVNHHAPDHGALILHGIRPALRALGQGEGGLRAALRPHWLNGPHVLIGLELDPRDPQRSDAMWTRLAESVQSWLDTEPPRPPLDTAAFLARAQKLAELEKLSAPPGALRPDRSVERGRFAVPHPLGEPQLAPLRDRFKAATLDDVFALVDVRLQSAPEALIEFACRIVCLERVAWRDGLNFWPLSLQGQARASREAFGTIARTFPETLRDLEPRLLARVMQDSLLDPAIALPDRLLPWAARLQTAYAELLQFVDAADAAFVRDINARVMRSSPIDRSTLSNVDRQTIDAMNHPTHFAYRMLMNFIYELFPSAGFSARQRLLVCHLITGMLEHQFPGVLARSYANGSALCR